MKFIGENQSTRGKNLSQCNFVHHNPTWTDRGSNPGLRGRRPTTNRLSHSTAHTTELVAFRNFATAPKNEKNFLESKFPFKISVGFMLVYIV
jgi:hypothetical protein